jgi:hypothetical protein
MVLGAVWSPAEKSEEISKRIREIKVKNDLAYNFEVKWTKVSPGKESLYLDLVNYFFDNTDLKFRAIVIPDKTILRHGDFNQDHDTWYYKMYFQMLNAILEPKSAYRIYLDIKDTRSAEKIRKLHQVLCNKMYDFNTNIIQRLQTVRSHEIEQMQLADLLIGAVGYANRGINTSPTKLKVVDLIRTRSKYSLTRSTLLRETKFNLFHWSPSQGNS